MLDEKGIGILDVKSVLVDVFKGCDVKTTHGTSSYHAEVLFDEYSVRIILSGPRSPDRPIYFRFMQESKGRGRSRVKRVINEVRTTNPDDLLTAIKDCKAHLLGVAHAIQAAFKPRPVATIRTIDDLMRD